MAFTEPKTWSAGDVLTAADMNTYVRDNVDFLSEPPACHVYNSSNISTTNGGWTALTFNSEYYDTDTMHSTVSNTGRITFTTAGIYVIWACAEFAINATGERGLRITSNVLGDISYDISGSLGLEVRKQLSSVQRMTAADYIQLNSYQASGGALNVNAISSFSPNFAATWIGE